MKAWSVFKKRVGMCMSVSFKTASPRTASLATS
uniref:Uncharacterized protein n=1 Tax=Lepeophtheirus salmonis TaxID=72036 RepID=A0A0K2US20_LEPSM